MSDFISGGRGNDSLQGGGGNDTYVYVGGDGFDTISDAYGSDYLHMYGVELGEFRFWKQNADLIVDLGQDTQGVIVKNQFSTTGTSKIDTFILAGTTFTAAEVESFALVRA